MTAWLAPPAGLTLGDDEVHVWRLRLVQPPDALAALAHTLSDDERTRRARFYFERDRNAYAAVRGALRTLAGHYVGQPPGALVFGYQAKGKPYLTAPHDALHLNVSHSGDYALLAFTRTGELGVDVERRRPMSDLLALARTSFSPDEFATLCRLPAELHTEAFFACWSRKEAFIKATGEGISQLAEFDVTLVPGQPARLVRTPDDPARRWALHELPAIPDHAAAIVVPDREVQIRCWDWPPTPAASDQLR